MTNEATDKVNAGRAIENQRLMGSRYIVVALEHQFDLDGLIEFAYLGGGFANLEAALAAAKTQQQQRAEAVIAQYGCDSLPWHYLEVSNESWPPSWSGHPDDTVIIPAVKVGDGTGYNSIYVRVAVFKANPQNPLDDAMLRAINLDWELNSYFHDVARRNKTDKRLE